METITITIQPMIENSEKRLKPWQIWLLAARPKTLPAAASPVIIGSAAAFFHGGFQLNIALVVLLAALLLQVGANLANDYFDYFKGADTRQRLGPLRVTQAGLLEPKQVFGGMWLVFGLAALLGVYVIFNSGWLILLIGVTAILAAIAYTGGPYPYGYYGMGEFFVFIFFGLAAVCGTYYAHLSQLSWLVFFCSLPMGFLITAILVVNNLRDIQTDSLAGKKTLAVRLGVEGTRIEFLLLIIFAYASSLVMAFLDFSTVWVILSWLSLPLAISLVRIIWQVEGRPLNQALAKTGQLTFVYAILFSLGLVIPVLWTWV